MLPYPSNWLMVKLYRTEVASFSWLKSEHGYYLAWLIIFVVNGENFWNIPKI